MDALGKVKAWIGGLTEIGLVLLALAIVAALLVGSNLPFFGNVTGNIGAGEEPGRCRPRWADRARRDSLVVFVAQDGVATRFLGSNTCDRDDVGWRARSHPTRCRRMTRGQSGINFC